MKYTLKVIAIRKDQAVHDGSRFFDVHFNILDEDGKVVEDRRLGYDISVGSKNIKSELEKFINAYNKEKQLAEDNKEVEAENKKADKVMANMEGFEA